MNEYCEMSRASMRCLLIFTVLVICINGSITSISANDAPIWESIDHPYDDPDLRLRDVVFINRTHGWIVGITSEGNSGGVILYTNNSGNSWQVQHHDASQPFRQIAVVNSDTLWIAGRGMLVYTTNGGQQWHNSTIIGSGTSGLLSVIFVNETHGWTSTKRDLYRTIDGGHSWENMSSWIIDDTVRNFHVYNSEMWAIGFYGIYYSDDYGNTWTQLFDRGGWSLSFVNEYEAWAVADNMVAHSFDGMSWYSQSLPRPSPLGGVYPPYFSDILFLDRSNGWIGGLETPIAYTPNGGWDWYDQGVAGGIRINSLEFLNRTHGWAVGSEGTILRTTRGNVIGVRLWNGLTDYIILSITGFAFIGVLTIIIVGRRFYRRRHLLDSIGID